MTQKNPSQGKSMSEQELYELMKEMYDKEMTRKDTMEMRIQIPIAMITAMMGGFYYLAKKLVSAISMTSTFTSGILLFLLGGSFLSICVSMVFFSKFLWPVNYEWMPRAWDIQAQYPEKQAVLRKALIKKYAKCADINSRINDRRADDFAHGMQALIIALAFAVLACLPYGWFLFISR
jgi:hypothetical protein